MGSAVGLVSPPPQPPEAARAVDVTVRRRSAAPGRPGAGHGSALTTALLAVSGAWLALLGGLLWWTNLPLLVGWQPRVVLTGSMMPSIQPGDVVLVAPAPDPLALPPGRIVVVADPTRPSGSYSHRVVRHVDGRIVTRGDANQSEDNPPVEADRVLGEIRMVVPRVGLPVVWLREHVYPPVVAVLLGTWAALVVVLHGRHPLVSVRNVLRPRRMIAADTGNRA